MAGTRKIKEIEADLYKVLEEYHIACMQKPSISFQGAVSEMAWEVEHEIEDITEDVC